MKPPGGGQPVVLSRRVEVPPRSAAATHRDPGGRVDMHVVHWAQVDHHPVVADGVTRVVVAAAADGDLQAALLPETDCVRDVLRRGAARDNRGPAVDGTVPDRSHAVIVRVAACQDRSAESRSECLDVALESSCHGLPLTISRTGVTLLAGYGLRTPSCWSQASASLSKVSFQV